MPYPFQLVIIVALWLLVPFVCFGQWPSEANVPDEVKEESFATRPGNLQTGESLTPLAWLARSVSFQFRRQVASKRLTPIGDTAGETHKYETFEPASLVTKRSREIADGGGPDAGPPPVQAFEAESNSTLELYGRIDDGKHIPLGWAQSSSMACWPGTQNRYYDGHHVLYTTTLPPRSEMFIELLPEPNVDLSLYAYTTGMSGSLPLPPKVRSAVTCEASHLYGIRTYSVKANPGGPEKVRLNAIRNPYRVAIGVVGAHKTTKGAFQLRVNLKTAVDGISDTEPPPIRQFKAQKNKTIAIQGAIDGGKRIPLDWAETSSMACWPGTQNEYYDGRHVLYTTTLPPRSEMFIELQPESNVDLSLYAYTTGMSETLPLPPKVRSAVTCEASHLYGIRTYSVKANPGGPEKVRLNAIRNPYRVVIGVVGAHKTTKGAFQLKVNLK
jgi:hypothetical protein